MFILNPIGQIQKSNDVRRQNDLKQLSTSLDVYYNDNSQYPTGLSALDDPSLTNKYIQSVPKDPNQDTGYLYLLDSDNPQWYVIFAKMENKPSVRSFCALEKIPNCVPHDYVKNSNSSYNLCIYSGDVDCAFVRNQNLSDL